jgi:acetyltransferase
VLESRVAADPDAAAAIARNGSGPFALKILSLDIAHKSDVGGVALDLADAKAVETAARDMLRRIADKAPGARLDGFILQQMVRRPMARELIIGLSKDPTFGPVVLFGQGGVEVEIAADRVMGLPPLNRPLARDMIARTRTARRLAAWRDRPAADVDAIADVLTAIAQLGLDFPQIAELDINPLSADHTGVLALDSRILLADHGANETAPASTPQG